MKRSATHMEGKMAHEKDWDAEAQRYIEGVAKLLIADSRAGPLLSGSGSGDEDASAEERVADVLRSLLADRNAWPASAAPLRDHIIARLDTFTSLLIAKLEVGVGLKRKSEEKPNARPPKKARKGRKPEEEEEEEEEDETSFAAYGRAGVQTALAGLEHTKDEHARSVLYEQLLLAPATTEKALPLFMAHSQEQKVSFADRLLRLQLLTFAAPTANEMCAGLRACASITREFASQAMQSQGIHDDAKLSVLKRLAAHIASCDARRRLASNASTAPLADHIKEQRALSRRRHSTAGWAADYYDALADLLKEYIKVVATLSSEFAVKKAYPELLFLAALASESDTRLPLALLRIFCELFNNNDNKESEQQQAESSRLGVVAHKLFFDFFVSEERVLRSNRAAYSGGKTAATVQQALSADPPTHYLRFALAAKRSVDFWTRRREHKIALERDEQIKLRKRKDTLPTRTGEGGGDTEEMRMLEATIDAGYKVPLPPSLKATLASDPHKQFHFRNLAEEQLLQLLESSRSPRKLKDEEDGEEQEVIVIDAGEEESEEGDNSEGKREEAAPPAFVIDTKGASARKHLVSKVASGGGLEGKAVSSLQRDVAALLEQLSDHEEES